MHSGDMAELSVQRHRCGVGPEMMRFNSDTWSPALHRLSALPPPTLSALQFLTPWPSCCPYTHQLIPTPGSLYSLCLPLVHGQPPLSLSQDPLGSCFHTQPSSDSFLSEHLPPPAWPGRNPHVKTELCLLSRSLFPHFLQRTV